METKTPSEIRCIHCDKLLVKGSISKTLEIKCNRCGALNPIFRDVSDQVIITDADGVILYANPLVEKVTGYSLQEVLGKKPSLWGGHMPREFYKKMWDTIRLERKPIHVTVKNKRKDGTFYDADLQITPVFDLDGSVKMYVGIESVRD